MCPSASPSSSHHFHAGSPTLCFADGETEAQGCVPSLAISLQPLWLQFCSEPHHISMVLPAAQWGPELVGPLGSNGI